MMIIDSQIHAYEANTPKRPWHSVRNWPASATGDETVAVPGPNLPVPKQNNDKGGPDSTSGPK